MLCMVPLLRFYLPFTDVLFLHMRLLLFYHTAQAFPLYLPQFSYHKHCLVCALLTPLFKRRHYMYST